MSWQAVTWVLENSQATLGARLVLLSIASHSNREGKQSWPSVETICIETRLSRREVQYALRELEDLDELLTDHRTAKTNSYELPQVSTWLGAQTLHPPGRKIRQKGAHPIAHEPFPNRPKENLPKKEQLQPSFPMLREPPKSEEDQAEVNRLIQGRAIKSLARKMTIPRKMTAREIEERKRFLREQAKQLIGE